MNPFPGKFSLKRILLLTSSHSRGKALDLILINDNMLCLQENFSTSGHASIRSETEIYA